jgi:hypothetical protein
MRQEISNPSDKATIDCSNLIAAHLAILILAEGKYGIIDNEGSNGMPAFLFGGHDEFFIKKHGLTVGEALDKISHHEIAKALDSIQLEGERTSQNDFKKYAHELANQLRSA